MKPLIRLCWLYFLAFLLLGLCEPAHAATGYQIQLSAYGTDTGHGLALGTYAFVWRLPTVYPTYAECVAAGDKALPGFRAPVRDDQSRLLPAYSCEAVR